MAEPNAIATSLAELKLPLPLISSIILPYLEPLPFLTQLPGPDLLPKYVYWRDFGLSRIFPGGVGYGLQTPGLLCLQSPEEYNARARTVQVLRQFPAFRCAKYPGRVWNNWFNHGTAPPPFEKIKHYR